MKFDVHVVDSEKRSQSGRCVEVELPESFPLSPLDSKVTEYTDEDGHASFETASEAYGEVTIYVNGENTGRFDLEEGAELTIVL